MLVLFLCRGEKKVSGIRYKFSWPRNGISRWDFLFTTIVVCKSGFVDYADEDEMFLFVLERISLNHYFSFDSVCFRIKTLTL